MPSTGRPEHPRSGRAHDSARPKPRRLRHRPETTRCERRQSSGVCVRARCRPGRSARAGRCSRRRSEAPTIATATASDAEHRQAQPEAHRSLRVKPTPRTVWIKPALPARLELAPQVTDEHIQRVRRRARRRSPRPARRSSRGRAPGADGAGRTRAARTRSRSSRSSRSPRRASRVSRSSSRSAKADPLGARAGAAQQRANARDQLLVRERLDEVVVRAGLQPDHPVAHRVASGQHQHGHRVARRHASCSQTSIPSRPGIITSSTTASNDSRPQRGKRLVAVLGHLDLEAVRDEHAPKRLPQPGVVVDNEDRHG